MSLVIKTMIGEEMGYKSDDLMKMGTTSNLNLREKVK